MSASETRAPRITTAKTASIVMRTVERTVLRSFMKISVADDVWNALREPWGRPVSSPTPSDPSSSRAPRSLGGRRRGQRDVGGVVVARRVDPADVHLVVRVIRGKHRGEVRDRAD